MEAADEVLALRERDGLLAFGGVVLQTPRRGETSERAVSRAIARVMAEALDTHVGSDGKRGLQCRACFGGLVEALGHLWSAGATVEWRALDARDDPSPGVWYDETERCLRATGMGQWSLDRALADSEQTATTQVRAWLPEAKFQLQSSSRAQFELRVGLTNVDAALLPGRPLPRQHGTRGAESCIGLSSRRAVCIEHETTTRDDLVVVVSCNGYYLWTETRPRLRPLDGSTDAVTKRARSAGLHVHLDFLGPDPAEWWSSSPTEAEEQVLPREALRRLARVLKAQCSFRTYPTIRELCRWVERSASAFRNEHWWPSLGEATRVPDLNRGAVPRWLFPFVDVTLLVSQACVACQDVSELFHHVAHRWSHGTAHGYSLSTDLLSADDSRPCTVYTIPLEAALFAFLEARWREWRETNERRTPAETWRVCRYGLLHRTDGAQSVYLPRDVDQRHMLNAIASLSSDADAADAADDDDAAAAASAAPPAAAVPRPGHSAFDRLHTSAVFEFGAEYREARLLVDRTEKGLRPFRINFDRNEQRLLLNLDPSTYCMDAAGARALDDVAPSSIMTAAERFRMHLYSEAFPDLTRRIEAMVAHASSEGTPNETHTIRACLAEAQARRTSDVWSLEALNSGGNLSGLGLCVLLGMLLSAWCGARVRVFVGRFHSALLGVATCDAPASYRLVDPTTTQMNALALLPHLSPHVPMDPVDPSVPPVGALVRIRAKRCWRAARVTRVLHHMLWCEVEWLEPSGASPPKGINLQHREQWRRITRVAEVEQQLSRLLGAAAPSDAPPPPGPSVSCGAGGTSPAPP